MITCSSFEPSWPEAGFGGAVCRWRTTSTDRSGSGDLPNKQIFAFWPEGWDVKNSNCGHSCPACHLAEPAINAAKTEALLGNLRFSGFFQVFGCCLHDNKLLLIHGVKQHINMLAAKAFFIPAVTVYELVHGNIKHADEFDENTKTRILPLFSIFIIVWDVRPTSSARYSCVQPLFSRASFIASPRP